MKFHIYGPCAILYLSHKLRCYTGISGPEKSCNNTCGKISFFFFTCVDVAHQLLTRHSPLAPLGQVDFHDSQYKLFVRAFSNYGD